MLLEQVAPGTDVEWAAEALMALVSASFVLHLDRRGFDATGSNGLVPHGRRARPAVGPLVPSEGCPSSPRSRSRRAASTRRCAGAVDRVARSRPGINALKTFDPPLQALDGRAIAGRAPASASTSSSTSTATWPCSCTSCRAGRLQLFDKRASLRDRTSRLLVRLADGRELRLREFGTKQAAWVKVLRAGELERDDALATLGPDAWPEPPADLARAAGGAGRPAAARACCATSACIAGIGRSWVDEILWTARLSPFKRGDDLDDDEAGGAARRDRRARSAARSRTTRRSCTLPIPDKLPLPLEVHRHQGEPCPRCGTTIEAVHYEDYVMCYCPQEQTGGRVLKDRRLSRLLK